MEETNGINWNDPNFYLFFIGFSFLLIPISKRELLIQRKSFIIITIISIFLFIIALFFDIIGYLKQFWGLISFYLPLYIVLLYRFMRFLFKKITNREPIDTALDFKNVTPIGDKIFNILYFTIASIMLLVLIYLKSIL